MAHDEQAIRQVHSTWIDAVNAGTPMLLEVKTRRVEPQLWGRIQR